MSTSATSAKSNVLGLRIAPHMKATLARAANAHGLTITQYVRAVLERSMMLGGLPGLDDLCEKVVLERMGKAAPEPVAAPPAEPARNPSDASMDEMLFVVHTVLLMMQIDFENSGKKQLVAQAAEAVRARFKNRQRG